MILKKLSFTAILLLVVTATFAQNQNNPQEKIKEKALRASNNLVYDANAQISDDAFVEAEATYRKAIAKSGENAPARFNLGNAYYENDSYLEALSRFKQATEVAATKDEKHKAFHNIGNVFMTEKQYEKAVEAYKQALRNNPTDDETRYNLALAKEMLKKEQQQNKNQQDKNDQKDQDKKDQENKNDQKDQDKKDNKEGEGENKDQKDQENKPQDQKEGQDQKNQQPENKDGDKQQKQPQDQKEGQPKPRPGQLSPQRIKNLLEAMNHEEKKVQEKLNAKKVKGVPVKTEKDW